MGGYPDPDASLAALRAVAEHADLIELGIPFSDPLADGPTIQAAGQRALDAGVRPGDVLRIAEQLQDGPPVVLMTYVNLLLRVGPRVFFERAARAGVAGMIIPDLPIDEGHELRDAARRAGVAMVAMAAPTTTDARLAAIGRQAEGFTYLVSVAGVTGGVVSVDDELRGFVERARRVIDTPLVVGFGIRTPDGFTYLDCTSVSSDGRTFCGYGYTSNIEALQAFVVTIPAPSTLLLGLAMSGVRTRRRS